MEWQVRGTRGGKPGQWRIQASTAESAKAKAVGAGVTVEQVKPLPSTPTKAAEPPAPVKPAAPAYEHPAAADEEPAEEAVAVADEEADEETDEEAESEWTHVPSPVAAPAMTTAVPAVAPAPAIPHYAPSHIPVGPAPSYSGITTGANVLNIFSILVILVAVLTVAFSAWAIYATGALRQGFSIGVLIAIGPGILAAIGLIAVALLIRLVAAVSLAIRDIARNSYR